MSEQVLRCLDKKHVLGIVTPGDDRAGRIYLVCRKCDKTWMPSEPRRDDPQLDSIRCCRRVPDGIGHTPIGLFVVGGGHGRTHHGELLARVALQPGATLILRCQNQRSIVNVVRGASPRATGRYRQTWGVAAGKSARLFTRRTPVQE